MHEIICSKCGKKTIRKSLKHIKTPYLCRSCSSKNRLKSSNTLNVEYYIKRGYTEEEGKYLISQKQKKRSKVSNDKRIGKTLEQIYGTERAKKIKNLCSESGKATWSGDKEKLKEKISNGLKNYYKTESSNKQKERFKKNRIEYNKNKLREINVNKSYMEKVAIKQKKIKTWESRPLIERQNINKKKFLNSIKNAHQFYYFNDLSYCTYQNNTEKLFIECCAFFNISVENCFSIPYIFNGERHNYFPDFLVGNNIIEIKGSNHWYKKDLESGKINAKVKGVEDFIKDKDLKYHFLLDYKKEDYIEFIKETICK